MVLKGSADVSFLLVGGMNVLGDMTTLEDEQTAPVEETTPLGVIPEAHTAVGVRGFRLTQSGFFNDASNRSNAALISPGASKVLCYAPGAGTLGEPMHCAAMVQVNYKRQIARGALAKASAEYLGEEGYDEAIILHPLGEETADGDSEAGPVDNAASSANGGTSYLQVTALDLDGYDSVTITVIDDVDGTPPFGDLVAFTTVTAAPFAERKTVTGTVERRLAVKWEFIGVGTAPSVSFLVGFKRN